MNNLTQIGQKLKKWHLEQTTDLKSATWSVQNVEKIGLKSVGLRHSLQEVRPSPLSSLIFA